MARTYPVKPTGTIYMEHFMDNIPRKPAGRINRSKFSSYCPALTLPGQCPHSVKHSMDVVRKAVEPDPGGHIRPAAIWSGQAYPVHVVTGV
jgi:hypothetical protein